MLILSPPPHSFEIKGLAPIACSSSQEHFHFLIKEFEPSLRLHWHVKDGSGLLAHICNLLQRIVHILSALHWQNICYASAGFC